MDISLNSKFYHFMSKIADLMILSLLWLLCSLPIVTFPAASAAMYYCIIRCVREESDSLFHAFFRAFRSNFKQGLLIFVLSTILIMFTSLIGTMLYNSQGSSEGLTNIYIVYIFVLLFLGMWLHFLFSYIARFQASFKKVVKNTLIILMSNLPMSISMIVLFGVVLFIIAWTFPTSLVSVILVPGLYCYITSFILERVYKKYLPEEEEENATE